MGDGQIRALHKIGAGIVCAGVSFALAGLVQLLINSQPEQQLTIAYQLPQYFFISLAEVFIAIPGLEFAYSQTMPGLRNRVTAMWYIAQGLGQLLQVAIALIPAPAAGAYAYFAYAGVATAVTVLFWLLNRHFRYRDVVTSVCDADASAEDSRVPLLSDRPES